MPKYVSKLGKWYPAKEYVVDPSRPRGQEVYEGPDRAALAQMEENGLIKDGKIVDYPGTNILVDPELVIRSRQLGFKSVNEMLHVYGWDKETAEKKADEVLKEITDHNQEPARIPDPKFSGGGTENVPGGKKHRYGGFGDPEDVRSEDLKKRA